MVEGSLHVDVARRDQKTSRRQLWRLVESSWCSIAGPPTLYKNQKVIGKAIIVGPIHRIGDHYENTRNISVNNEGRVDGCDFTCSSDRFDDFGARAKCGPKAYR
jgi:hypothetical protein